MDNFCYYSTTISFFFNNESKINLEGAGLGRRDGPLSNSSAEGAAFIPMVGAICLGLNRLSPVGWEKLPSKRQRYLSIVAVMKGK